MVECAAKGDEALTIFMKVKERYCLASSSPKNLKPFYLYLLIISQC
jgi:hypothetical protein